MQRWYSRLAGYHRLACLGGKSQCNPNYDATRHFSSSSFQWARRRNTGTRKSASRRAEEDEDHPAYLPASKLPSTKERQHADAWISLLNTVLPERLRAVVPEEHRQPEQTDAPPVDRLTPRDVALILRRAQRSYDLDLLTYLGVEKGQWKAVSWLVTRIVDKLWEGHSDVANTSIHAKLPGPWKSRTLLKELTQNDNGIMLNLPTDLAPQSLRTLDEVTIEDSALYQPLQAAFNHETLGVIWRSLGNMIIADAARTDKSNPAITPEILEVIALLHHNGMMPSSIYSYQPSEDPNALRQPPTLHLLSSHILTSLSDAAWRAHESLVVEEAKSKGGEYLSMRPEIPGSMFKIHVAGLGHEVWLELVLWSCLHGKWIEEGASILRNVVRDRSWSALSWRELATPLIKPGQEKLINWDDLRYRLHAGYTYGDPNITRSAKEKVKRTLSTEVIAAFVDALLDVIRTSVGIRGTPAANVHYFILAFKSFLGKNKLSLGSTSWDAVVLRFFDSHGLDIQKDPALAERIVRDLSSEFGEGLSATNAPARNEEWQPLPAYVLDGTAIAMGLMHRVLRSYIQIGNFGGALRTFEELQRLTDRNKEKSIQAFFARQAIEPSEPVSKSDEPADSEHGHVDFHSHLTGIEYPAFYPQLPSTILASFFDLITETRSFDFGNWLIHSTDIDGPVVPPSVYTDPVVGPALVRFASANSDIKLLVSLLEAQRGGEPGSTTTRNIPQDTLMALLQGQVSLRKWDTVDDILDSIRDSPGYPLSDDIVSVLVAAVLREVDPARGPSWSPAYQPDLDRAFNTLMRVTIDAKTLNRNLYARSRTALMVLSCISPKWESFIWSLQAHTSGHQGYAMTSRSFNNILEAVVTTYGVKHGKLFLSRFWRAAGHHHIRVDESKDEAKEVSDEYFGVRRMPLERPGSSHRPHQMAISITIGKNDKGKRQGRLYGTFTPNIVTVHIVLRQALKDCRDNEAKKTAELEWATGMMRLLGLRRDEIKAEIDWIARQANRSIKTKEQIPSAGDSVK